MLTAQPRGPEAVIGTVCDFLHGRVVGSGPVSKLELTCKNGFDVGALYIGGLEATFWNEFMTLEREGERLATFSDLITMLDAKTGMPVTSATAEESQELTVVHVPVEHIRLGAGMRSRELFLPCEEAIGKPMIAYAFPQS